MPKNNKYNTFAVTISPPNQKIIGDYNEVFKVLVNKIRKLRNIERSAYCVELGKSGCHPHIHLIIDFNIQKRLDVVSKSIKQISVKYFKMEQELNFNLVRTKKCIGNGIYVWLKEYMTKENPLVDNDGFDVSKINEDYRVEQRKVLTLANKKKPIYQNNILEVYRYELPNFKSQYTEDSSNYISEYISYLDSKGYAIVYLLKNLKLLRKVICFHHNRLNSIIESELFS